MAERRPLVVVSGQVQELPSGDTLPGGGGGSASTISNTPAGNISATTVQAAINELDSNKQAVLVSGTTIKTVNGSSLLGSGDLTVSGDQITVSATAPSSPTLNQLWLDIS